MKKFFQILFWLVILLGVAAAVAFAELSHRETVCQGFELLVEDENIDPLIESSQIKARVLNITDTLIGRKMIDIDLHKISDILEEIPWIAYSDIQTSISGSLKIEVGLRRAVMRVVNHSGVTYYIDSEGWLIPVNQGHPGRVIIANGNIKDGIQDIAGKKIHVSEMSAGSIVNGLFEFAMYIDRSPFLKRLVAQAWVNKEGEVEITPVLGKYTVKFGGFDDMKAKFDKLETFYREGAAKAGWIAYRSIDLRYRNQIICSKK